MAAGDLSLEKLSGSTDGKGIKVTGTSSGASVTAHTAHATAKDLIDIEAVNTHATDSILVTIEFGGTTDPDHRIYITIPARVGPVPILQGMLLTNSLVVKVFAATADVIMIYGRVRRCD
jgi:hypothetical protein